MDLRSPDKFPLPRHLLPCIIAPVGVSKHMFQKKRPKKCVYLRCIKPVIVRSVVFGTLHKNKRTSRETRHLQSNLCVCVSVPVLPSSFYGVLPRPSLTCHQTLSLKRIIKTLEFVCLNSFYHLGMDGIVCGLAKIKSETASVVGLREIY